MIPFDIARDLMIGVGVSFYLVATHFVRASLFPSKPRKVMSVQQSNETSN